MESFKTCTDDDGNKYKLVYMPYVKGNTACQGCAFTSGNSSKCRAIKSCTPKDSHGNRLVGAGFAWKMIKHHLDK